MGKSMNGASCRIIAGTETGPSHMNVGFEFEIIYKDAHLMMVRIAAWNGSFGGAADVYMGLDQMEEAAGQLQGFPTDPSDAREITFGGSDVRMRFYCAHRSGHGYVDAAVES